MFRYLRQRRFPNDFRVNSCGFVDRTLDGTKRRSTNSHERSRKTLALIGSHSLYRGWVFCSSGE